MKRISIALLVLTSVVLLWLLYSEKSNVYADKKLNNGSIYLEKTVVLSKKASYQQFERENGITIHTKLGDFGSKSGLFYLKAPQIVDIKRNNKSLNIYFKRVKGATGYYIYERKNGNWYEISDIKDGEDTCYIDSNYYTNYRGEEKKYTVVAYRNVIDNRKIYSKYDTQGTSYVNAPTILSINKEHMKWTKVNDIDGYEVLYKDKKTAWKKAYIVDKDVTICDISKIYKKNRCYSVRAYKKLEHDNIYSDYEKNISLDYKKYSDKRILFEGDRIIDEMSTMAYSDITYPQRVEELLDAKVAINSNRGDRAKDIVKRINNRKKYFTKQNIICIAIGTNDYEKATEIGTIVDDNSNTFYGALVKIVEKIREQNKGAKVVFITPVYRGRYGNKVDINCNFYKNKRGYTLQDYSDAIRGVAKVYKYNVYDVASSRIISPNNVYYATANYIYPRSFYQGQLGCELVKYMAENHILK